MKRTAMLAVAAVTAFAPIVSAPAYADPPRYEQSNDRHERNQDSDGRYARQSDNQTARDERRDHSRDASRDRRSDRRGEARNEHRWDHRQHNGYTVNGRWYYGAPSSDNYNRADFRPGYEAWQRGQRVPSYYRDRAHRVDYREYRDLRAPPRGYQYVRDDRGAVLLVGIATGVILATILTQ
jgi:Ni/Co efflux regulator RcnB